MDTGWETGILPAPVPLPGEPIEQSTQLLLDIGDHRDGANSVVSYNTAVSRMTAEERRQSHVNLQMMNLNPKASKSQSMVSIPTNANDPVALDRSRYRKLLC